MVRHELPLWGWHPRDTERCERCGREFSLGDPRRGEWQQFVRADGQAEWICAHCLTDVDLKAIADSFQTTGEWPDAK